MFSLTRRLASVLLPLALTLGAPRLARANPTSSVVLRSIDITGDAAFAPEGRGAGRGRVKLTLDPKLQRTAERLLAQTGAHEAAIVASDVRTGRVLVYASRGGADYVATPFAPSASLFKIATAAALLGGGKVSPATTECYEGGEHAVQPADLEERGTVCTTVGEALGHSVNLVFARLAKKHLAPDDLRKTAKELGFDGDVPIDVPASASALRIPDDPFGMARAAAGFWNGKLTALGALFAMQTIANEGERVRLSILDHGAPTVRTSYGRAIDASVARDLRRMLEVTVRRGTSAKAFRHADGSRALPQMGVAAKTGTLIGGSPARMYSWFAAFAPSTKPEIAVAIVLGNDLRWRLKANQVGRDLLEAYFDSKGEARKSMALARRARTPSRARVAASAAASAPATVHASVPASASASATAHASVPASASVSVTAHGSVPTSASASVTVPASAPVSAPVPVPASAPAPVPAPVPVPVTVPASVPVTVPASAPVTAPVTAPASAHAPVTAPASPRAPAAVPAHASASTRASVSTRGTKRRR